MFSLRFYFILAFAALFLVACGSSDNSTSSQNSDDGSVQLYGAKVATSAVNLPTCDSNQVGQLFYVLADQEFQFCSSEGYQSIDLNGIAGADGADGKDGANGSNGEKGADGVDGSDGSSCSVISNANGSKTILCEDGTTATVSDGASCTVANNGDGSYDLTCSGTTVTVRDGKDGANGTDGASCLASKSDDSLFVDCDGVLDTIVDGKDGANGTSCTVSDDGAGTLTQTCTDGTSVSWPKAVCGTQAYEPTTHFCDVGASAPMLAWSAHCLVPGNCGTFTDTRETPAKKYKWTKIGTQTWMAENLAYLPSVNAKTDVSSSVAKYYVYNYDGTVVTTAKANSYYTTYGVLYNWIAAMAGSASSTTSPSGVQGACPSGWHMPSSAEWTTLETYLGGSGTAGTKLKSVSGWTTSGVAGTDTYGFSALPGGYYYGSGFDDALGGGNWWTATEVDAAYAYFRYMYYDGASVNSSNYSKGGGFSVRCLQD